MAEFPPLSSLARLTLRQLRTIASQLGVSLYSRKSKQALVQEIGQHTGVEASSASPSPESQGEAAFVQTQTENSATAQTSQPTMVVPADLPEPQSQSSETSQSEADPSPSSQEGDSVVFLPRDPEWGYVFWEISSETRKAAETAGAQQLCLRVSDVTGMGDGAAHPHTLQEVPIDANAADWHVPMPLSNRDYRVELGFRLEDAGWLSVAFSAKARVPAANPSEQILDQFVPFSLDTVTPIPLPTPEEAPLNSTIHERLYQVATGFSLGRRRQGSEVFQQPSHELGWQEGQAGFSDSAAGIWASGRTDSGAGMARQRSFWLVADAELIVYGATDPSASLTIGDEPVPLTPEGTFRIQVPFRDGQQQYAIKAVAADGEQKREVTMAFQRTTPCDNTNTAADAVGEWF
ncbi:MAG: Rho termination protein [Candidatus Synechococcus spongiarum 142]|uniref:Rho termination protein n=1 Tax=Candidatus Synechococcus spongiarum 142 TaxID=1608213 RepID=A0A6N3X1V2_9SYNE|nr:MAG: Rho termination protein [Candidatus Synechococcus spongiarum 142]